MASVTWLKTMGAVGATLGVASTTSTFDQAFQYKAGPATQPPPPAAVTAKVEETMVLTEQLLDAKLEAAEARTETKFAQLLGELKLISGSVSNLSGQLTDVKAELGNVKNATATVKWNVMATGLAIGGLILALAAYGATMWDLAIGLVGAGK